MSTLTLEARIVIAASMFGISEKRMATFVRKELLPKKLKKWVTDRELKSLDKLNWCIDFEQKNSAWPSQYSTNCDESSHGRWIVRQRCVYNSTTTSNSKLYSVVMATVLIKNKMGIFKDQTLKNKNSLNISAILRTKWCIDFFNEHGHYPRATAANIDPIERQYARWLHNARSAYAGRAGIRGIFHTFCMVVAKKEGHENMFKSKIHRSRRTSKNNRSI